MMVAIARHHRDGEVENKVKLSPLGLPQASAQQVLETAGTTVACTLLIIGTFTVVQFTHLFPIGVSCPLRTCNGSLRRIGEPYFE